MENGFHLPCAGYSCGVLVITFLHSHFLTYCCTVVFT